MALCFGLSGYFFKGLCIGFLSIVWFNRESSVWSNGSTFSFRLGGVARSCSLIDLGQRLGIYPAEDANHPLLDSYLDNCILLEPREYNHLDI